MKLNIKKVRNAPFESNGETINYNWYKAIRGGDGVTIEFGSVKDYSIGEDIDIELEKYETSKGGYRYKEVKSE